MGQSIHIIKPDDFHVHFRQGRALQHIVVETAKHFGRALVMPNTEPAIRDTATLSYYIADIHKVLANSNLDADFQPLMTFKIYKNHTKQTVQAMKDLGALAGKYYPQGATTNAEDGIKKIEDIFPMCEFLSELNMVLCIHGEDPTVFVLEREKKFLESLENIREHFPTLKIVLEHISSKEAITYIKNADSHNIAATITTHHLLYTLDAVLGGMLNPHMFCKPVLKTPDDLEAIQSVVLDSNERFFLGTDSAPHPTNQKECASGCAGVFSAPVTISLLTDFFYENQNKCKNKNWRQALENFCSIFGADFYNLKYNTERIEIIQEYWTVPHIIHGFTPLCAGKTLAWRAVSALSPTISV